VLCQYVRIQVADPLNLPVAFDLDLSWPSGNPGAPLNSDPLVADYTYYQEDSMPEGPTELRWYRNDVEIPWLFGQTVVPAYATEPGQKWYFTVLPKTGNWYDLLVGDLAISEMVYVGSDDMPDVNKDGGVGAVDIQMVVNAAIGKTVANAATDVNHSGQTNAVDVQAVVNKAVLY
jgi:hypothetical protein